MIWQEGGVPEMHIQIALSTPMPSPSELAVRRRLETSLDGAIGRVTDTGAGGGVMELWLQVDDPVAAHTYIRQLVLELGLADRTRVTVRTPKLHVTVHWDDTDLGATVIAAAEELADLAEDRDVATVTSIFGTDRSIDIAFDAPDPDGAATILRALAENLGIAERTTIKTR